MIIMLSVCPPTIWLDFCSI